MKKLRKLFFMIALLCFLCGSMVHAETDEMAETTEVIETTETVTTMNSIQRYTYTTFEVGQWVEAKQEPRLANSYNGYFYIPGAISWGFCAQNSLPGWYNNQVKGGYIVEWNDATVRKILYYAPGSPGYTGTNTDYDMDNATYATGYMNGDSNSNTRAQAYIATLANLTDPIVYGYKAYYMYNSETAYQDIAFLGLAPTGSLEVVKYSSNSNLTNNNSNYSLAGAVYGVYAADGDYSAPEYTITLSEWSDGWSGLPQGVKYGWGRIEGLTPGNYWVKEITAPNGFELDQNWYPSYSTAITVTSGTIARVNVYDNPKLGSLEIYKSSTNPEITTNNAQYSLKGAVYGVYFADGDYTTPEYKITTDKNGYGVVKGIPIGAYRLKEITPPQGFLLDENWYPGYQESICVGGNAVATIKVKDKPEVFQLNLIKKQENTDVVIPDVSFEHKRPDGTIEVLHTDANGMITLTGIQYGSHEIKEISALEGYLLNENTIIVSVEAGKPPAIVSELDQSKGKVEWQIKDDRTIEVTIYNRVVPFDLVIQKQNNTGNALEGAEFAIYLDASCTNMVQSSVTDAEGKLEFTDLISDTRYYVKEVKAPTGYCVPTDDSGNPIITEIMVLNVPAKEEFKLYVNGTEYEFGAEGIFSSVGTKTEPKLEMVVINEAGYKLPQTGSSQTVLLCLGAIVCFLFSIFTKTGKRKERKE